MAADSDARDREIAGHYRMLKETARRPELPANRLGQEPDADGDAGPRVVQQFNRTLARLEALDAIPAGMFAPLPEDAGWASMCIAHEQLAAFIGPPDGVVRADEHVEEGIETRTGGPGSFVLNFRPSIGSETDATEIGKLARAVMPKEMRAIWKTMHRPDDDGEESADETHAVWHTVHKMDREDQDAMRKQQVADFLFAHDPSGAELDKKLAELRELAERRAAEAQHDSDAECCPDD